MRSVMFKNQNIMVYKGISLALMLGFGGWCQAVYAEPKTADASAAVKKAQGMIRQLSQEKSALEAEKATLVTDKAALEAKLSGLEATVKKLQPLESEVEKYKTGLETVKTSLESQLSQQRQREQALQEKHRDVVGKANTIYADNQLLVLAIKEREQWIGQCTKRNKDLQTAYNDVLTQYKEKGFWQQVAELEPLTGIGQVTTQSVAEDYKYKLQQLKMTPFEANAAPSAEVDKALQNAQTASVKEAK